MKFNNFLLYFFLILVLISCTEKQEKISVVKENNLEMQMIEAYNEGLKEFNNGDIFSLITEIFSCFSVHEISTNIK